jgi:hypothetical protein
MPPLTDPYPLGPFRVDTECAVGEMHPHVAQGWLAVGCQYPSCELPLPRGGPRAVNDHPGAH